MSKVIISPYAFGAAVAKYSLSLPGTTTDYLTLTPSGVATNPPGGAVANQIGTISFFFKSGDLTNQQCIVSTGSAGTATDSDFIQHLPATAGDPLQSAISNAGKRRTSTGINDNDWHHICLGIDTSQGTEIDRMTVEIDLVDVTSYLNDVTLDEIFNWMLQSRIHVIGHRYLAGVRAQATTGNLAEYHQIDGEMLAGTNFAVNDGGTIKAINYAGSFGNNGCLLKFQNVSDLGEDSSGNGLDWTEVGTGLSQSSDVPPSSP